MAAERLTRVHAMPFGAELRDDGSTRFRLYAPTAPEVELVLTGADGVPERIRPADAGEGWKEVVAEAAAGDRYAWRLPDGLEVPDPASRFQPDGVHRPSRVVDPTAYRWRDGHWRGRPWEQVILYELHVGAFSPEGGFDGVRRRLDRLAELGVTALELMPLGHFAGHWGWGYDGVLPFAPHAAYGRPDALKHLVDEAHARGLMVFLDVVYNHFGPEGNYLHAYAHPFFRRDRPTPWGPALDFDGPAGSVLRDFFVHNALYWLREYHMDGLRLDAVHVLVEKERPTFLEELEERVRGAVGEERHVHLVLEDDLVRTHRLRHGGDEPGYDGLWTDDVHHAAHVVLTGETGGYYEDYREDPFAHLGRALAEGLSYQGEPSAYRKGVPRGGRSAHLPPTRFVSYLQNHDQVGNRARGERLTALVEDPARRAAQALLLLSPQIPLLFMGEELASTRPFLFFCDFHGRLAESVRQGRRRDFARFEDFARAEGQVPDPNARETFSACVLDGARPADETEGRAFAFVKGLLAVRRRVLLPLLDGAARGGRFQRLGPAAGRWSWELGGAARWTLTANLGEDPVEGVAAPDGRPVAAHPEGAGLDPLAPGTVVAHLQTGDPA